MNSFIENPCGEPISLTLKFEQAVKRDACKFLLVLFLFCTRKEHIPFSFKKKKVDAKTEIKYTNKIKKQKGVLP